MIEVIDWNEQYESQAYALLNKYRETSIFLLSNVKNYGTKLTDASYSGNFKFLVDNDRVVAVFALVRLGNLIVQTDRAMDYSKIIVDECLKESVPLKGIVGDWDLIKPMWNYAKTKLPDLQEKLCKKEVLLQMDLNSLQEKQLLHEIRYLEDSDFEDWDGLNQDYLKEMNLDQNEELEARHKRFLKNVLTKYWHGLFINSQLVSMACAFLNIDEIVWIGGVYTLPKTRRQGLAKEVVYNILRESKIDQNKTKAILFTDEDNYAAIELYKNLGFKRIGYFGLAFGDYKK